MAHACQSMSNECLRRNTTDRQGVPRKGRPNHSPGAFHDCLHPTALAVLETHCPLRELPSLPSQITAQGQGERVERIPRGGVPPAECLQDSPLGYQDSEGPGQQVPREP